MLKILVVVAALLGTAAAAQNTVIWIPGNKGEKVSTVTLQPTTTKGAVAEVVFKNEDIHNFSNEANTLRLDELVVEVLLTVNQIGNTPDTIEVVPPEGLVAVPSSALVEEGSSITIYIYPLDSVGM